jgi:hypothetical protein
MRHWLAPKINKGAIMTDSLMQSSNLVQSLSFWDTILAIVAALIGGGLVTLIFDSIKGARKANKVRRLIKYEIKMNLDVLESDTIRQYPWMGHKTWTSFYDSNSIEVTSFTSEEIAEKILKFYSHIETLRMRDLEDREVDRLNKEKKYDAAETFRIGLGKSKQGIRNTLIELAHSILDSK